jgi:O-antigen/teichoic acid export membrane protein
LAVIQAIKTQDSDSLSYAVAKGGFWIFALKLINRGMGFVRTIILARILSPEDFGILGIAMLSISILDTFSQTGLLPALIQKKENVESYLDTAWTFAAIRGLFMFLILFSFAPLIAKFFSSPHASLVIKVIALSTLFSGFRNIGIVYFQKKMEFHKQFWFEATGTLIDLCVAIPLAFILRDVWALVWAGLAAQFVKMIISYYMHPYRPRIRFQRNKFLELFEYGKWIIGSSILVFLITKGDDIFVGKFIGAVALGYYQMAYLISNLPSTEISHIVARVTFPAYSKIQVNYQRLKDAYLNVLQVLAFLIFPLAGLTIVFAEDFTRLFLGAKWLQMVPSIQVLALAGLVRSLSVTSGPLFHGTGQPQIVTKWQPVRLLVLVLLIYPLTLKLGILGTSFAVFFSNLISAIGFGIKVKNFLNCRIWDLIARVFCPLMNTLIAAAVVIIFKDVVNNFGLIGLLLAAAGKVTLYICLSYIFDRTTLLYTLDKLRYAND